MRNMGGGESILISSTPVTGTTAQFISQIVIPFAAAMTHLLLVAVSSEHVPHQNPTTNAVVTNAMIVTKTKLEPVDGMTIPGTLAISGA